MNNEFIQVAEFDFPFPSENYKTELINSEIEFQEYKINESESIISVFSVNKTDIEKAIAIKKKVDVENSISEIKHKNKLEIKLAYIAIIAIIMYIIYKAYNFMKFQLL